MFQSSPSPKAGSYNARPAAPFADAVSILSQPEGRELPVAKELALLTIDVSILSQPEGRELLERNFITHHLFSVSILSQPEGRELQTHIACVPFRVLFQSSPSPKAGSYPFFLFALYLVFPFQSSPSPKAGSYSPLINSKNSSSVSILSQPEGRELQTQVVC